MLSNFHNNHQEFGQNSRRVAKAAVATTTLLDEAGSGSMCTSSYLRMQWLVLSGQCRVAMQREIPQQTVLRGIRYRKVWELERV